MSNFTVDDTYGTLLYGPGWGISSVDDTFLAHYFQSTYHASQSVGAAVNLTFTGSAIYLYGSKGPTHASYSVRCDGTVHLLSAVSMQQQYRQLLFSSELPSGTHLLTFTNANGLWVDLDFVTVTGDGNLSSTTGFSSTIAPLVLSTSSSSAIPLSSPPSSTTNASSQVMSHTTTIHTVTFVLAIVFGILFFCAMISGLWLYLLNRSRMSSKCACQPPLPPVNVPVPGSAFLAPQEFAPGLPSSPPAQYRSDHGRAVSDVISETAIPSPMSTRLHSPTAARPWSPFSGPLKHVFRNSKLDGTDSMKSTFLKVQ